MDRLDPTTPASDFRTPPRILIPKLVISRDKWKVKATDRKRRLHKEKIAVAISPTAASSGKTAPWLPISKPRNSNNNSIAPKRTSPRHRLKSPNSKMTRKKTDQPGSLLVSSAWRAVFLRSGFFLRRSLPPHRRVSTLCRCGLRCFRPPFRSRYPRPFVHDHSRLGSASGLLRLAVPLAH